MGANAQSRSSFQNVGTIDAIGVDVSNGGKTYNVSLGAAPSITLSGIQYTIQDVFGFWVLSNNDITATQNNTGVWTVNNSNSGAGGIAGWKTNPNTGLTANQSKSFTFNTLVGSVDGFGFHVRLANNGAGPECGNTLYVTGTPVPEPATMTALALGAAALLRRRRR